MSNNLPFDSKAKDLILASWLERFIAWIIDFVVVSVGLAILFTIFIIPLLILSSEERESIFDPEPIHYIISSLVFFLYWTYFESTTGQTLGKRVANIKTTNMVGETAERKDIAISSFGKAFILPIDVILGWIYIDDKRQRIFNRLSNTVVIRVSVNENIQDNNIKYIKGK